MCFSKINLKSVLKNVFYGNQKKYLSCINLNFNNIKRKNKLMVKK